MTRGKIPLFKKSFVINLDESKDRLANISKQAALAGVPLQRWPAVNLKKQGINLHALPSMGVGKIIYLSRGGEFQNLGAIGCYLSHKSLYEHLAKEAATETDAKGYLIFEDDVEIPLDFKERLRGIEHYIPDDWDIIYLDKAFPTGYMINDRIARLAKDTTAQRSFGNHAYIIRAKSIGTKILPYLKQMTDEVDIQLNQNMDTLNCYIPIPTILNLNHGLAKNSSIYHKDRKNTGNTSEKEKTKGILGLFGVN